jgi:hypothetical protein
MRGYPAATSPICGGKFCGQNATTTSEFYQAILNIIQKNILHNYQANREEIKQRLKGLSPNSYQRQVLSENNIKAINNANSKSKNITTTEEFQAYLKYCMFNLNTCAFQTFGEIKQGFWPISELNILLKEGIISKAETTNIYANINGKESLRILEYVFQQYSKCSFNLDYDCDGIFNHKDNCPYTYNPQQADIDGDGKGNVCDDDIDGDGQKNPTGIVDDNDNIIISKRDKNADQTPLGETKEGF